MDIRKQLLSILDEIPDAPTEQDFIPHLDNLKKISLECETKTEYRKLQQQFERDLNASVPINQRFIQIFSWMITAIDQSRTIEDMETAIIIAAPALRQNMPSLQ